MQLRIRTTVLILASLLGTNAARAADPTGDWQVEGGFANIRVAECGGAMWGVVAWEKKPGAKDTKNPDPAKQSRPTLGMVTLFDMKKSASAEQWDGEVYDAQFTGSRIRARMSVKDANTLRIEGCPLGMCLQGQDWTRAGPPIPSSPANMPGRGAMASANPPAAKGAAPKAAPGQTADIGDICLLPEVKASIASRGRQ